MCEICKMCEFCKMCETCDILNLVQLAPQIRKGKIEGCG